MFPTSLLLLSSVFVITMSLGCTKDPVQDDALNNTNTPKQDESKDLSDATNDAASDAVSDTASDAASDAASDTSSDQTSSLPTTCTGACATTALASTFANKSSTFTTAFYGLTAANKSTSGSIELYMETYVDGSDSCPSEESPTPAMTLITSGITFPLTSNTLTTANGVVVKLLDFDGSTLGEGNLIADPTSVMITPQASAVCEECLGDPEKSDNGFVRLDMNLAFDGGTIKGQIYAKHCDSMDES